MSRPINQIGAILQAASRTVEFDASISEAMALQAQVTDHEVEEGAAISDHVRPQPRTLTLQVISTTSPVNGREPSDQRDRQFRREVVELWQDRELLTVRCELGVFEGFVIQSVQETIDAQTGEAFVGSITLREIRRAVRVVTLVPPDPADERRLQRAQNGGSQQGQTPDGQDEAAADELQANFYDAILYNSLGGTDEAVRANATRFGNLLNTAARGVMGAP